MDEAVEAIKQNTRHFAKRQLTWFRKEKEVIWVDLDSYHFHMDAVLEDLVKRSKEIL